MLANAVAAVAGSPPLARGRHKVTETDGGRLGITPARAGTATGTRTVHPWSSDHPRSRGDGAITSDNWDEFLGSPPLARGRRNSMADVTTPAGITPARAWTAPVTPMYHCDCRDHPRSRGDGSETRPKAFDKAGSPPLARGRHRMAPGDPRFTGITPARAGTAPGVRTRSRDRTDHPRSRGDGRDLRHPGVRAPGITPARAGTARTGSAFTASRADHPRSRGDG